MDEIKNKVLKTYNQKIQTLFICIGISILSGVTLLTTLLTMAIVPVKSNILLKVTLPTVIALVIIPVILAKLINKPDKVFLKWNEKELVISCIAICIFSGLYYVFNGTKFGEVTILFLLAHYFIAAFSEEFLYRHIILNELLQSWNVFFSALLCGLIFSLLGHIGDSPLDNLLYRFPLGVFFSIFRLKTNSVLYTSVIHAFYNLLLIIG